MKSMFQSWFGRQPVREETTRPRRVTNKKFHRAIRWLGILVVGVLIWNFGGKILPAVKLIFQGQPATIQIVVNTENPTATPTQTTDRYPVN